MTYTPRKKTIISVGTEKAEQLRSIRHLAFFFFEVVEVLLVFRLIFKFAGANPDSPFIIGLYTLTQALVIPFLGIFRQATAVGIETTAVLEPATLVAVVVYAVAAWGVSQLIAILSDRSR